MRLLVLDNQEVRDNCYLNAYVYTRAYRIPARNPARVRAYIWLYALRAWPAKTSGLINDRQRACTGARARVNVAYRKPANACVRTLTVLRTCARAVRAHTKQRKVKPVV